jgi:hypothetical protein
MSSFSEQTQGGGADEGSVTRPKIGRPSLYSPELCEAICALIAGGRSLRKICARDDMPCRRTIENWLARYEDFRRRYAFAHELQADQIADEILEIADAPVLGIIKTVTTDGSVETTVGDAIQRRRLRIDARKWHAGKLAPKKYGRSRA